LKGFEGMLGMPCPRMSNRRWQNEKYMSIIHQLKPAEALHMPNDE